MWFQQALLFFFLTLLKTERSTAGGLHEQSKASLSRAESKPASGAEPLPVGEKKKK